MAATQDLPKSVLEVIGHKFNRLTVTGFIGRAKNGVFLVECQCDCGNKTIVRKLNLLSGHTTSCGCQKVRKIHGGSSRKGNSALYNVWRGMRQRCLNPNRKSYKNYGARGIQITWANYLEFKRDMEQDYKPGLTIERKDNNGPYSRENCRWATRKDQCRNHRRNRYLTFNGQTLIASEWAERYGLTVARLLSRLKLGWTMYEALTTPKHWRYK